MSTGKTIRLKRIFDENDKAVIFAAVHNMTSVEPFLGQVDVGKSIEESVKGGATAQVISKGFLKMCAPKWHGQVGILNYLFTYAALSPKPIQQVLISTVEESARMGADGICFFVGLATEDDDKVIELLGKVGNECDKHGLVFICEAEFPGFYGSMQESIEKYGLKYLKFTGRLCAELGADAISSNWPGTVDQFAELVDYVKIPVLMNGGPKMSENDFLKMIEGGVKGGASGCLVGRNFSESKSIEKIVRAASLIIKDGKSLNDALKALV
ncbi:MAG: beta/alpha barrel domain-containing protein [Candidatus Humimicrobiaceae bacterium]